jgi:hypothetical protein
MTHFHPIGENDEQNVRSLQSNIYLLGPILPFLDFDIAINVQRRKLECISEQVVYAGDQFLVFPCVANENIYATR